MRREAIFQRDSVNTSGRHSGSQFFLFFFRHLKVLKTSYFAPQTSLECSAGGPDLLTASARRLPRQPPHPKNVPLILKSIFSPPLPTAFKVMLLLPAARDGRQKLRLRPLIEAYGHLAGGHTRAHVHLKLRERKNIVFGWPNLLSVVVEFFSAKSNFGDQMEA